LHSTALWNEARNSGLYYRVEPLSGLDLIDLLDRGSWDGRNVEVFPSAVWSLCGSENGRTSLDRPSE